MNAKTGFSVLYYPSKTTKARKFPTSKEGKEEFAATVTDVNEGSLDLAVMGGHGVVDVAKVPHKSEVAEGRSYWDYL